MSVTNEGLSNRDVTQSDLTDKIGLTAKSSIGKTEARNHVNERLIKDHDVSRETSMKNSVDTTALKVTKSGFQTLSLQDKALYLALFPIAHIIGFYKRIGKKTQKSKLKKNFNRNINHVKSKAIAICGDKVTAKPLIHHALFHNNYVPKLLTVVLAVGILYVAVLNIPTEATLIAYVDGQKIGAVKSVKVVELAMLSAEQEIASKNGYDYKLSCEVTYDIAELNKPEYVSNETLQETFESLTQKDLTDAVGLYIDGSLVAVSSDKLVLEKSLKESLDLFEKSESNSQKTKEREEYGFANKIEYLNKQYPKNSIMDEEQVRTLLGLQVKSLAPTDSVQKLHRDSVTDSEYPRNNSIQTSEPQKVLPTLKLSGAPATATGTQTAQSNQSSAKEATLNYSVTKEEVVKEALPYQTIYQNSEKLLSGQTSVVQKGVNGLVDSKYKVEYVDGKEIGRTLVDQAIIKETTPMVVVVGTHIPTKEELAVMPTGTYILPYKGKLTSPYGWRKDLGYREYHAAWDICGPLGSSVVAIDGGTVIFTGKEKGYGNYVMVDHGNGIVSLYAHLKSITVKVGTKIGQGGEIGKMGRTGQATGVHVHLEIRKNNVAQNPQDYLQKP